MTESVIRKESMMKIITVCKKGTWKISTGNRAFPVFGRKLED